MMNPHPDRSDDARELRNELQDDAAKRALDQLNALRDEAEVDVPPVPDDLRDKWRDRYGEAREEVATRSPGFWSWLRATWHGKVLGVGAVAFAAMFIVLLSLQSIGPGGGGEAGDPILRGGGEVAPAAPEGVVVVLIAAEGFGYLEFEESRAGIVLEARDLAHAEEMLRAQNIQQAVVLHLAQEQLLPWDGTALGAASPLEAVQDVYELSEAVDLYIETLQE